MDTLSFKTVSANKASVQKEWLVVDATDQILGRFCSKVARLLRGKHKPYFTPHIDCGDNVIVINADKIRLTGKKWTDRVHFKHSGYPGSQVEITPEEMLKKNPASLVEEAVRGMLPKNRLGRAIFKNLYVYAGPEHKQTAQNPKQFDINTLK